MKYRQAQAQFNLCMIRNAVQSAMEQIQLTKLLTRKPYSVCVRIGSFVTSY